MGKRFDIVNMTGIGGIGIWALGYDDGYTDFWDLIQAKFTDCAAVPCTDTIYDLGGPNRNYYNNEQFTYTIAPANATNLSLNFTSFATEPNFDTLYVYDGASISAPLLGAFHGTTSPGTLNSTGNSLTVHWKSDNATQAAGWRAIWTCSIDVIAPTTQISLPSGWATQNFTTTFTDADNIGGSGIEKSFYQVLENTGAEWRANNTRGFFSDNFDTAIHPDWTSSAGTWAINAGYLEQSNEANTNTNIYAPLTQNLSNRYLYTWGGKIDGAGASRRAGFHFFCDDASQTNRGNSYLVWFRADQSQLQIYKVINNALGSPVYSVPVNITIGAWYSYAVAYDRITGKMDVYVNNSVVGSWTDSAPYSTGNYISFRTGECNYMVNDFKAYRARAASATVLVGAASTNDVRYQNPNPTTPSCRVKSITKDAAGNLSLVSAQDIDVDWTAPDTVLVSDGVAADIDNNNSLTQLTANWTASSDSNSGIVKYWFAIGTTPNGTDIDELSANFGLAVYPNPFANTTAISYYLMQTDKIEILICDVLGQKISLLKCEPLAGNYQLAINAGHLNFARGVYVVKLKTSSGEKSVKIVLQ